MTTVTLKSPALRDASNIHLMTAMPMNVDLTGLTGGNLQFQCNNALPAIRNATSVKITYDATVRNPVNETIDISSVMN